MRKLTVESYMDQRDGGEWGRGVRLHGEGKGIGGGGEEGGFWSVILIQ